MHPRRLAYIILNNVTLFALFTHFFCYSQFFSQFTAQKAFFPSPFFQRLHFSCIFSHISLQYNIHFRHYYTFHLFATRSSPAMLFIMFYAFSLSHFNIHYGCFQYACINPIHTWSSCSTEIKEQFIMSWIFMGFLGCTPDELMKIWLNLPQNQIFCVESGIFMDLRASWDVLLQ